MSPVLAKRKDRVLQAVAVVLGSQGLIASSSGFVVAMGFPLADSVRAGKFLKGLSNPRLVPRLFPDGIDERCRKGPKEGRRRCNTCC
ncbi:MAG: hypothetical protein QE284_20720 [Rhizobium sp.]|nr:hypothetical protein [Rhizobium sp.]